METRNAYRFPYTAAVEESRRKEQAERVARFFINLWRSSLLSYGSLLFSSLDITSTAWSCVHATIPAMTDDSRPCRELSLMYVRTYGVTDQALLLLSILYVVHHIFIYLCLNKMPHFFS